MGIVPDRPATGYGYIEEGDVYDAGTGTEFRRVLRFVEKPDEATAMRYLETGRFSWNAGMFIWKVSVMEDAFAAAAPDIGELIGAVSSSDDVDGTLSRLYPGVRSISVDFAVMEKAPSILVAKSRFLWDDVGSWLALPSHFGVDSDGNTRLGSTETMDTRSSIVVSTDDHLTAVLGLENVVVVHTPEATLVCDKSRLQDVKKLLNRPRG